MTIVISSMQAQGMHEARFDAPISVCDKPDTRYLSAAVVRHFRSPSCSHSTRQHRHHRWQTTPTSCFRTLWPLVERLRHCCRPQLRHDSLYVCALLWWWTSRSKLSLELSMVQCWPTPRRTTTTAAFDGGER